MSIPANASRSMLATPWAPATMHWLSVSCMAALTSLFLMACQYWFSRSTSSLSIVVVVISILRNGLHHHRRTYARARNCCCQRKNCCADHDQSESRHERLVNGLLNGGSLSGLHRHIPQLGARHLRQ